MAHPMGCAGKRERLCLLHVNRLISDGKKARKVLDALIEANKGMWPELK